MREKGPIDRPKSKWVDASPKGARLRTKLLHSSSHGHTALCGE